MSSNERSAHPSAAQIQALVEYLEGNRSLAKGYSRTQSARERSRRQWEQLALRLNSIGGTTKSSKQWNKYWTDKKSAVKKKAAARAAARRKTGGGVEEIVELTAVEEKIIALFGGDGFFKGDELLGIHPFNVPSQVPTKEETGAAGTSEDSMIPQQRSPGSQDFIHALVLESEQGDEMEESPRILHERIYFVGDEVSGIRQSSLLNKPEYPDESVKISQSSTLARRLFASPEEIPGTSRSSERLPFMPRRQSALSLNTFQPTSPIILSPPPPVTLSRTPTPLRMPRSPVHSRMGHPPSQTISPSRRGATSQVPQQVRTQTRRGRTLQGARAGSRSHHSTTPASPPSQRRREFARLTERFLKVEEQQLELQRSNARMVESMIQQSAERERGLVEAVTALGDRMLEEMTRNNRVVAEAVGEGLMALAEAIKRG